MNQAVLFTLAGTRGAEPRLRVLEALDEQAQNTHELAESLDMSRPTLDHHLSTLKENGLIEKQGAYNNAQYQLSRQTRANWDDVEELLERVKQPAAPMLGIFAV